MPDQACDKETAALIPHNVTRYADLPSDGWTFVAVAPWTSPACVDLYLAQVRTNPSAVAAIFYQPGNSTTSPGDANSAAWNIGDGGKWKNNPFPIYAVPGIIGTTLMEELSLYSGNMTDVPHGDQLVHLYDSRNFVRLYTRIDVNNDGSIPSLWEFLIIVLCILLAVVIFTSAIMHLFQAKRRRSLQRRVRRGEVDLEALGIKRLNVPQNVLDKMPIYTYAAHEDATSSASTEDTVQRSKTVRLVPFSQPTCPICLDDFVENETKVRELPCNHIFHPECIDSFLRDNSSLCPMCKKSTLPSGYCPVQVTNLMVRRERLIRRMRDRLPAERDLPSNALPGRRLSRALTNMGTTIGERMQRRPSTMMPSQAGTDASTVVPSTEMSNLPEQPNQAHVAAPPPEFEQGDVPPPEVRAQGASARRAWRRERLARAQREEFSETARAAVDTRPPCKSIPQV